MLDEQFQPTTGLRFRGSRACAERSRAAEADALPNQSSSAAQPVPEPSKGVFEHLKVHCSRSHQKLLHQLCHMYDMLTRGVERQGSITILESCKQLAHSTRDMHATVVEVDDELMDSSSTAPGDPAASDCRLWLKQIQELLIQWQRDLEGYLQTSTDIVQAQWEAFCKLQATRLRPAVDCILVHQKPGDSHDDDGSNPFSSNSSVISDASSDGASSIGSRQGSKLVCQRSRLRYSTHWAKKIAL